MAGKYSVKETKDVLDLMFTTGMAFKAAKADGSIGLEDLGQVLPVIVAAGPAFKDVDLVPKELGELDEADVAEILSFAGQKLPHLVGENEKLLRVINKSLVAGVALISLVAELRAA